MNIIDRKIVEQLNKCGFSEQILSKDIQSFIWFPANGYEKYTVAIRTKRMFFKTDSFRCTEAFVAIDVVNHYINCSLSNSFFINVISQSIDSSKSLLIQCKKASESKILIEHTSMTPAYPINVATFRSSVIGNALNNYYLAHGIATETHYLVANGARQISLPLSYFNWANLQHLSGKSDYICGLAFVLAYGKSKGKSVDDYIPSFINADPEKIGRLKDNLNAPQNKQDDSAAFCDNCINGHLTTLNDFNIPIDIIDYETKLASKISEFSSLECKDITNVKPYLLNNIAFNTYYAEKGYIVHSVVDYRQNAIVDEARSFMVKEKQKQIVPFYFNDVVDKSKNPDKVPSNFHAVDMIVKKVSSVFNISIAMSRQALMLYLLNADYYDLLALDYYSYDNLKTIIEDLLYYDGLKSNNSVHFSNSISEYDIQLSKLIMLSFDKFNDREIVTKGVTNQHLFKTSEISEYCFRLIQMLRDNQPVNFKLYDAALAVINCGFSLLGVI